MIGLALAACGREPTGAGATVNRAQFDLRAPKDLIDGIPVVSLLRLDLAASRPEGTTPRPVGSYSLTGADVAGLSVSGQEIAISISFPLQGWGTVYRITGEAVSALGVRLFTAGPAEFREEDLIGGNMMIVVNLTYVGPVPLPPVPVPPLSVPPPPVPPLPVPPPPLRPLPVPPLPLPPLPLPPIP